MLVEKSVKYALAAFVGWLLVGVAHALPEALLRLLRPFFRPSSIPLTTEVANLVTVVGWVATVVFSLLVLMDAWKAFRNRVG
jgi:hypothetical protein